MRAVMNRFAAANDHHLPLAPPESQLMRNALRSLVLSCLVSLPAAALTWDEVEGNWKQFEGSAKSFWGDLTDDEVMQIEGNREKLEGLLQEEYGKTKEEAQEAVDEWLATH
jgi:uncharacterized protein YjbJ (UPF0337 family)